ncbi:hypothetical protein PPYR_10865 [Photinus pyralis]|uniref:Uncharacterized protein n=2 Tax=Photinus pyralis TaxID=7054 RepID=A0A1Y1JXJ5_PHOPY|nr:hypothetical protein PPYR_10865 [Photinus pyralis]
MDMEPNSSTASPAVHTSEPLASPIAESGPAKKTQYRQTVFREEASDHDYLGTLPGTSNPRKRQKVEDSTEKIYKETLNVLRSIDNNVSVVAHRLDGLTKGITEGANAMKQLVEMLAKRH